MCWRSSENKRTPGAPVDPALCVLFDLFLEHSVNCISPWQLTESAQQSSLDHVLYSQLFLSTTDNCTSFPLYYLVTMLQTPNCNTHDDISKTYLGTNRKNCFVLCVFQDSGDLCCVYHFLFALHIFRCDSIHWVSEPF